MVAAVLFKEGFPGSSLSNSNTRLINSTALKNRTTRNTKQNDRTSPSEKGV